MCAPLGLMAVLATYELMGNWLRWCFLLNATWIFCGRPHGWSLPLPLRLVIEQHFCDTGREPWWGSSVFPQSVTGEKDSEGLFSARCTTFNVTCCDHFFRWLRNRLHSFNLDFNFCLSVNNKWRWKFSGLFDIRFDWHTECSHWVWHLT